MHKTFIYVLTDGSKFQEERKEERDDVKLHGAEFVLRHTVKHHPYITSKCA